MRVGDRVRLTGIPDDIEDVPTRLTFRKCLGHEFTVTAIDETGCAELEVEAITGTSGDKIYVPSRFLKNLSH